MGGEEGEGGGGEGGRRGWKEETLPSEETPGVVGGLESPLLSL